MANIQSQNMGAVLSSMNSGGQNDDKVFNIMTTFFGKGLEKAGIFNEHDVMSGLKAFGTLGAAEMLFGMTNASKGPLSAIFAGVFNKEDLFAHSINTTQAGAGSAGGEGGGGGGGDGGGSNHAFSAVGSAAQGFAEGASYDGDVPMAGLGRQSPQATPGVGAGHSEGMGM